MHCHRNPSNISKEKRMQRTPSSSSLLVIMLISCVGLANCSRAGSTDPVVWKKSVSFYIERVFTNNNKELRKFYLDGAVPIGTECKYIDDATCVTMEDARERAFLPDFYLHFAVSTNPFLKFVFVDNAHIGELATQAELQFKGGISETSDFECQVFSILSGAEIQSSLVLVSADQSPKKIRACLIYQSLLALGIGDTKVDKFSFDWGANRSQGTRISALSETDMDGYQNASVIIESIHMCKQLIPGMDLEQVKNILLSTEDCFVGLKKKE